MKFLSWKTSEDLRPQDELFANPVSYGSDAEDLVFLRLRQVLNKIGKSQPGYYVDIGAYHPVDASNTYCLYKLGWSGLNIEANPDYIPLFNELRPRDRTVNIGLSSVEEIRTYHKFSFAQLNGFFDEKRIQEITDKGFQHLGSIDLKCMPLDIVISDCVPRDQSIDFLSVDIEGLDDFVWDRWDWSRRPKIIAAEIDKPGVPLREIVKCRQARRLEKHGYDFMAFVFQTGFFVDRVQNLEADNK
jgi:hypothetical protein